MMVILFLFLRQRLATRFSKIMFKLLWRNVRHLLVTLRARKMRPLKKHMTILRKFGIGGANMPTRTPIPVSRAMRQISVNLDLARRQQRIPVALLAERAGLSMPTVTKMLRTGNGSFENFLRIARLLGLLDGVQQATDPLNTDIGKLRADEDTPKRIR